MFLYTQYTGSQMCSNYYCLCTHVWCCCATQLSEAKISFVHVRWQHNSHLPIWHHKYTEERLICAGVCIQALGSERDGQGSHWWCQQMFCGECSYHDYPPQSVLHLPLRPPSVYLPLACEPLRFWLFLPAEEIRNTL